MFKVIKQTTEKIKYPVIRKGRKSGAVVIFFSENYGVVLDPGQSEHEFGYGSFNFPPCYDYEAWVPVEITITG